MASRAPRPMLEFQDAVFPAGADRHEFSILDLHGIYARTKQHPGGKLWREFWLSRDHPAHAWHHPRFSADDIDRGSWTREDIHRVAGAACAAEVPVYRVHAVPGVANCRRFRH